MLWEFSCLFSSISRPPLSFFLFLFLSLLVRCFKENRVESIFHKLRHLHPQSLYECIDLRLFTALGVGEGGEGKKEEREEDSFDVEVLKQC